MKLKIVKDNNPIMRKKSLPVEMPLSNKDKGSEKETRQSQGQSFS